MTLSEIYAAVPSIDCIGRCARDSCGLVSAPPAEVRAFKQATGHEFPDGGFLQIIKTAGMPAKEKPPIVCVELDAFGRCGVYENRPLWCRLSGTVDADGWRCGYGCAPARWLSIDAAKALVRATWEMDGRCDF